MKFNFDLLKMDVKTIVLSLVIIVFAGIFVWNLFYSKEGLTNKDESEEKEGSDDEEGEEKEEKHEAHEDEEEQEQEEEDMDEDDSKK